MSSPPPGYNPEASQLHGGTDVPIAKVMGGGGAAPEGYNETQSLLHGGTDVPIVKMTGGATDLSGATTDKPSVRFANSLGPGNVQGKTKTENGKGTGTGALEHPSRNETIQMEVYETTFTEEDSTEIREFVTSFSMKNVEVRKKFIHLIESFKRRSKNKLVRYDNKSNSQSATIPSVTAPQTLAHKIVEILPSTTSNIIIIPPVKGNYEMFIRTVEFLYATNVIDENDTVQNAVIIFMTPFFTEESNQQKLLYSLLHLQEKNHDTVFVLNNDDEHARTIGNAFYTDILPGDGLYLNYLNPSYVILPKKVGSYEGIIFSSSTSVDMTIPKASRGFLPLSKLLGKKSFSLNATANSDETFLKYLIFISQNGDTQIPKTISGTEACGSLKTVFDLKDPGPFKISSGNDIYILRFETNRRPLLCTTLIDEADKFKGAEQDPAFHDAPTIDVYVDGQKWKFRDPSQNKFTARLDEIASGEAPPESRNPVIQNWERSIYSTSEAGFLNHLNLSPLLLGIIFKSDIWKAKVAGFLNNMVTSNCFEDTAILSKGVCEETRVFLNTVFNYLFVDSAVKQDELNVPPLKLPSLPHGHDMGEIKWPPELEEITADEFKKEHFGSLDVGANTTTNTYFTDLIVIHKKSTERSMRRLRLDRGKTDDLINEDREIKDPDVIFAEVLEDLKDDHPDFLFIY